MTEKNSINNHEDIDNHENFDNYENYDNEDIEDNFLTNYEIDILNTDKDIYQFIKDIREDERMNNSNNLFKSIERVIFNKYGEIGKLELAGRSFSNYLDNEYCLIEGFYRSKDINGKIRIENNNGIKSSIWKNKENYICIEKIESGDNEIKDKINSLYSKYISDNKLDNSKLIIDIINGNSEEVGKFIMILLIYNDKLTTIMRGFKFFTEFIEFPEGSGDGYDDIPNENIYIKMKDKEYKISKNEDKKTLILNEIIPYKRGFGDEITLIVKFISNELYYYETNKYRWERIEYIIKENDKSICEKSIDTTHNENEYVGVNLRKRKRTNNSEIIKIDNISKELKEKDRIIEELREEIINLNNEYNEIIHVNINLRNEIEIIKSNNESFHQKLCESNKLLEERNNQLFNDNHKFYTEINKQKDDNNNLRNENSQLKRYLDNERNNRKRKFEEIVKIINDN